VAFSFPTIIGRYLPTFCGSLRPTRTTVNGARASAIIYSIVETAKANNLKPYEYLKHLLTEIPKRLDLKTSEYSLDDLLPWADAIPDCCRLKTK
jgi:hypothetical protein